MRSQELDDRRFPDRVDELPARADDPAEAMNGTARAAAWRAAKGNVLTAGSRRARRAGSGARRPRRNVVVSGSIETSYVEHAYIEPEAGSAWMDGDTLVIKRLHASADHGPRRYRRRARPAVEGQGAHHPDRDRRRLWVEARPVVQPLLGLVALKTGRPARADLYAAGLDDLDDETPSGRQMTSDDRCDRRTGA
jgi:aldehyde oxidoreductase